VKLGSESYPEDLETLVKGVPRVGTVDRKLKFLRRIPVDPITGTAE
jgi:general secretion pathway protein G